jgi:hypothetical protein
VGVVFDEQQAIKVRLRQIDEIELRMVKELELEREILSNRLQDLENGVSSSKEEKGKSRRPRESVRALREIAVAYLRERKVPVRAVEIQQFIERANGKKITNMSAFMRALQPEYERVQKLGRGLYIYEYGGK